MAEKQRVVSPEWTMSLEAEESGKYNALLDIVEEAYGNARGEIYHRESYLGDDVEAKGFSWIYPYGEYRADALSHFVLSSDQLGRILLDHS